jgi:PelA/Pel-15E family pectate lyase
MKTIQLFVVCIFCATLIRAQSKKEYQYIDTALFEDNAHHWYGIAEKDQLLHPKKNQPKYRANQLVEVANNVLLYQKNNGGWPKNYDIMAILDPEQIDTLLAAKDQVNTTFDNRTTYSHIACLSKVYFVTKDERYKTAAIKGLDFILKAQYANGGWPQYYPLQKGNYSTHITYNDDAMCGIMKLLKDIKDAKPEYVFIHETKRKELATAFDKGLDCILKTQIKQQGQLTAWCQQHDEVTLEPAWARKFEPPSICNSESADIVLLLMSIEKPSNEVVNAIQSAVAWFKESMILNTRVQTIDAPIANYTYHSTTKDKIVVTDSAAPPIWARYYELGTHRPVFCNRDSKLVYTLAEVERERRTGYGWYTYEPQKVLREFVSWNKRIAAHQ